MSRVKLKLDENLGTRGRDVFERFGYDVLTVSEQKLQSANDSRLVDICRQEARCLVSLDLDFANPLFFNPQTYAGLAVLRLPSAGGLADILRLSEKLAWPAQSHRQGDWTRMLARGYATDEVAEITGLGSARFVSARRAWKAVKQPWNTDTVGLREGF